MVYPVIWCILIYKSVAVGAYSITITIFGSNVHTDVSSRKTRFYLFVKMKNRAKSSVKSAKTKINKLCKICGDRAPRIYYGILACDGCKSFFRRAVRGGHVYKCRYNQNCNISKDMRTQCRHCRFEKCLESGMKREAIQSDRDPIGVRKPASHAAEKNPNPRALTLKSLILADELIKEPSRLTLGSKILEADGSMPELKIATIKEHHGSMKEQLLVMVTWAKSIPAFCELSQDDKVALLQAHSLEYALIGLVRRSLHLNDVLLLANGFVFTRDNIDIHTMTPRIIDELVLPFKSLNLDDTEFAILKAIVFFDPHARGLSEPKRIEGLRKEAQVFLEEYINNRPLESSVRRVSDILVRLVNLQSIAVVIAEEFQILRRFGLARIDKLLREMLLGEDVKPEGVTDNGVYEDTPASPQSNIC